MRMALCRGLWLLLALVLTSCGVSLSSYQQQQPEMDLFEFFTGNTKAWGMVQDYRDKQIRRFEVNIVGTRVADNELRLEEYFLYDDGEKQTRVWLIRKTAEGQYEGRADDVIGVAKGSESGNALRWQYTLQVPTKNGLINLQLDDWMYRQDVRHVFNLAKMKKFGIEVGSITLFFQKVAHQERTEIIQNFAGE